MKGVEPPQHMQLTAVDGEHSKKAQRGSLRHSRYSKTEGWRRHRKALRNTMEANQGFRESSMPWSASAVGETEESSRLAQKLEDRTGEKRQLAARQ